MNGYVANIEQLTEDNENFRTVLYTAPNSQLVVMHLQPHENIGEEVHELDQFIRVEEGVGKAVFNDVEYDIEDGLVVVIPQGIKHNIINTSSDKPMKLYTVYSPAEHQDGTIHITKADAMENKEHFDGRTTEDE